VTSARVANGYNDTKRNGACNIDITNIASRVATRIVCLTATRLKTMEKQLATTFAIRYKDFLHATLSRYLGLADEAAFAELIAQFDWIECEGGVHLFEQGDPPDAAYFLVSGRLRALFSDASGNVQLLGDVKPGETVGEVAVLSDSVRSATIIAARDSVVVRVSAERLREWFIRYPQLLLNTAKLVINRTKPGNNSNRRGAQVGNIAVVPLTPQVDMAVFRTQLQDALHAYGKTLVLDASEIDRCLGEAGLANVGKDDAERYFRLSDWLDAQADRYDFVIYIADRTANAWTQRCLRQADRLLLLADARDSSALSAFEQTLIAPTSRRLIANTFLALWHPSNTLHPSGTQAWLTLRPWVSEPIHIRADNTAHMSRLARLVTGNAIGLVLGSGGARGLSHVGVFRALQQAGIPIDRIGGTSIGAIVAACIGSDWNADELDRNIRYAFGQNPTNLLDVSWLPLLSLFRGKRMYRLLGEFFPEPRSIEDLWINYFCVSSDIANTQLVVHTRGPLLRSICASAALPGVFPPVRVGDGLHVDGAFMNALPVDVMGALGVHRVIAVDLHSQTDTTYDFDMVPGPITYLLDRLIRGKKRRYRIPTLVSSIIQSSLLASEAKRNQARIGADILFNPDVRRFDLMAWSACDKLINIGYQHASQVLASHALTESLSAHQQAAIRMKTESP